MDRKILVLSIITIAIVACGCLTAVYLVTGEHNDNKADDINESNEMNKTANITEDYVSESVVEESSTYEDPHSDWVCEGDSWYSVQIGDGDYAMYDKSSGKLLGTGDMPDRHGYHDPQYVEQYKSSVKYRSNGEYYND